MNVDRRGYGRRKARNGFFAGVVFAVVLLVGVGAVTYWVFTAWAAPLVRGVEPPFTEQLPAFEGGSLPGQTNIEQFTLDIALTAVSVDDIVDTGYLVLVNRENAFNVLDNLSEERMVQAWPAVPVSTINGVTLHPTALSAAEGLFDAARGAQTGSLFVSSGFRDMDEQRAVYNSDIDRAYVLPPGHSEHHTGLAADIFAVGIGQWETAGSAPANWLENNAYKHGLILRYPQGAESITGVAFEPWHFRYVGRVHAYYMKRNNLVLEQYIALLSERGHISVEIDGQTYHVLYQTPADGVIYVPLGLEFTVSSDNTGGFVILICG